MHACRPVFVFLLVCVNVWLGLCASKDFCFDLQNRLFCNRLLEAQVWAWWILSVYFCLLGWFFCLFDWFLRTKGLWELNEKTLGKQALSLCPKDNRKEDWTHTTHCQEERRQGKRSLDWWTQQEEEMAWPMAWGQRAEDLAPLGWKRPRAPSLSCRYGQWAHTLCWSHSELDVVASLP